MIILKYFWWVEFPIESKGTEHPASVRLSVQLLLKISFFIICRNSLNRNMCIVMTVFCLRDDARAYLSYLLLRCVLWFTSNT